MERARLESEAGTVQGAYVCKKYVMGIAEIDWVKGTVIAAKQDRIRVRIDDPGTFPHDMNGSGIAKGSLIWDEGVGWAPCVRALAVHAEME